MCLKALIFESMIFLHETLELDFVRSRWLHLFEAIRDYFLISKDISGFDFVAMVKI